MTREAARATASVVADGVAPPNPPATLTERLQAAMTPLLGVLPAPVLRLLARERAVVMDGQTLDPQLQLIRAVRWSKNPYGYCEPTVPEARARLRREAAIFTGARTPVGAVRELTIPGAEGPVRARHYAPPGDGGAARPLVVYLHGGGFVVCDLDTHDEACRIVCRYGDVHVLSVDYRLAPEHPFPAGLHDAQAALRWAQHNAASLGADPGRVGIGGDSAGGNLATVASRLAARAGEPPAAQLLIYPATDPMTPWPSKSLFGQGFFLNQNDVNAFARYYVEGTGVGGEDPLVAPLHAPDLWEMPPAVVVVAGFDVLRDEGVAYAEALRRAGNEVRLLRYPSLGHAFINMTGVVGAARDAMVETARAFGALLREGRGKPPRDLPTRSVAHGV